MKKKIIIFFITFILLLLSILFVNSYAKALSKEEKLQIKKEIIEQEVRNDRINEEQTNQIYQNIEERMINCDINCNQNNNCQIYKNNGSCMRQDNQCVQENCNHRRNCNNQQNCNKRICGN